MKSKSSYIKPAASVIAALLTFAVNANAATIVVPTDYPTIQAAANAAASGDTIKVLAGNYAESVTINTSVTVEGAQAGTSGVGRTFGGASESTLDGQFSIQAANVTIDGFSITQFVALFGAYGVVVNSGGSGAIVTNNVIENITTPDPNGTAQGIYLQGGPDNVQITDNKIKNISSNRSAKGILLGDNNAPDAPVNTVIQGNTITNITSTIRGAYGVGVGNSTSPVSGLVIADNMIANLNGGGWVHAIGLEANTPSVSVTGNDFSGLTGPAADNIAVWFEGPNTSFATAEVHQNNFNFGTGSFGVKVDTALTGPGAVNATCNWWNKATGPTIATNSGGTGTRVSAKVTYSPWLNAQAPLGICVSVITNKDQAKGDGWKTLIRKDGTSFKNQGDAIQYINTKK